MHPSHNKSVALELALASLPMRERPLFIELMLLCLWLRRLLTVSIDAERFDLLWHMIRTRKEKWSAVCKPKVVNRFGLWSQRLMYHLPGSSFGFFHWSQNGSITLTVSFCDMPRCSIVKEGKFGLMQLQLDVLEKHSKIRYERICSLLLFAFFLENSVLWYTISERLYNFSLKAFKGLWIGSLPSVSFLPPSLRCYNYFRGMTARIVIQLWKVVQKVSLEWCRVLNIDLLPTDLFAIAINSCFQ